MAASTPRHGGVFDPLACIPALRIFRLFRIFRAVKIIHRLGGPRAIRDLLEQFVSGTLYPVIFLGLLTLEVIGLLELFFEMDASGANITTGGARCGGGTSPRRRSATATSTR